MNFRWQYVIRCKECGKIHSTSKSCVLCHKCGARLVKNDFSMTLDETKAAEVVARRTLLGWKVRKDK